MQRSASFERVIKDFDLRELKEHFSTFKRCLVLFKSGLLSNLKNLRNIEFL